VYVVITVDEELLVELATEDITDGALPWEAIPGVVSVLRYRKRPMMFRKR
jgi:hypothetical protein